jgi:hypothetical protein
VKPVKRADAQKCLQPKGVNMPVVRISLKNGKSPGIPRKSPVAFFNAMREHFVLELGAAPGVTPEDIVVALHTRFSPDDVSLGYGISGVTPIS